IAAVTSHGKFAPASAAPATTMTMMALTGPWPRESNICRNGLYRPASRISRRMNHRYTARAIIAGMIMMTAPMIQCGTQEEIASIQVIRTCTVIESDAVFADDCFDYPRRREP